MSAAGPAYVGLGEVAYQRNDLDTALWHVTEGAALCRQFVYTPPLAAGLITLAWIRQANGDPAGALDAMEEAMQASPGPAGMFNPVPARRARLLLAQGDLAGAVRATAELGLSPDDEMNYPRELGHLVLARVLLARGEAERALALLDRLHAAADAQDRPGSLIEVGALRALAARGDETAGLSVLAEALTLACPQDYVRVFADEGPPMAALLGRLVAAQRARQAAPGVPFGYLARLQRAFGAGPSTPDHGPGTAVAVQGIVDPLTSRELEVLKMLAAGRSNQAIAGEHVVTLDTVKKHVGHVLGKLGAANRTEAVARARALNLPPERRSDRFWIGAARCWRLAAAKSPGLGLGQARAWERAASAGSYAGLCAPLPFGYPHIPNGRRCPGRGSGSAPRAGRPDPPRGRR